MGRTGNQIKSLEVQVDSLASRLKYLENFVNRMNRAVVVMENLVPSPGNPTAMQSLIQYIIATVPKEELDKIMGR